MYRNSEVSSKLAVLALSALPAVLAPQAMAGTIALPVTTDVTVTNSSLPVTGSVSVSNTAANPVPVSITGNVSVAGTSNVNVTNTPSVNVANGTLNVSDVNNPAFQPWTYSSSATVCSTIGSSEVYVPAPPAGRTLVIESVNLGFNMPAALFPGEVSITTNLTAQGLSNHQLLSQLEGTSGGYSYYVSSQTTRFYSQPGQNIILSVGFIAPPGYNGNTNVCINGATISGYLVNTP